MLAAQSIAFSFLQGSIWNSVYRFTETDFSQGLQTRNLVQYEPRVLHQQDDLICNTTNPGLTKCENKCSHCKHLVMYIWGLTVNHTHSSYCHNFKGTFKYNCCIDFVDVIFLGHLFDKICNKRKFWFSSKAWTQWKPTFSRLLKYKIWINHTTCFLWDFKVV